MSFGSRSLAPPTKDERERMDALKQYRWCVACCTFGPVELHHILSGGGLRLGHRYTVSLCKPCHSAVKTRAFKALYTNQALLDASDYVIACNSVSLPIRPERARPSPTARPTKRIGSMTTAATRPAMVICVGNGPAYSLVEERAVRRNATRTTAAPDSEPTVKRKQKRRRPSQCTAASNAFPRSAARAAAASSDADPGDEQ